MDIDLNLLHNDSVKEIDISGTYTIPDDYLENTLIKEAKNLKVDGKIYMKNSSIELEDLIDYIKININGEVIIQDSISLEDVKFPISVEYDDILEEIYKKDENTLDIFHFLWENIEMEIPLKFTKVKDLSKFHGDGWKLISEDDLETNKNNPFSDLLKNYDKE